MEDVHGNRTEVEWQFTVELDVTPPSITATSPYGIIRADKPIVSVSASDDRSGVDTIDIVVKDGRGARLRALPAPVPIGPQPPLRRSFPWKMERILLIQ